MVIFLYLFYVNPRPFKKWTAEKLYILVFILKVNLNIVIQMERVVILCVDNFVSIYCRQFESKHPKTGASRRIYTTKRYSN